MSYRPYRSGIHLYMSSLKDLDHELWELMICRMCCHSWSPTFFDRRVSTLHRSSGRSSITTASSRSLAGHMFSWSVWSIESCCRVWPLSSAWSTAVAHVSWIGSVRCRSPTTPLNGRLGYGWCRSWYVRRVQPWNRPLYLQAHTCCFVYARY